MRLKLFPHLGPAALLRLQGEAAALEVCDGHVSRVRVQQRGGRVTHVRGQGGTRAPGQTLSPGNTQSPHQASPRPGPWLATGNRYFEVKLNHVSVNITFYSMRN